MCNRITNCTDRSNCQMPNTNQFILMRINNFFFPRGSQNAVLINAKLTRYNIDQIRIPNLNNYTYKIQAAIMYNGDGRQGHYVCWKRTTNGWLRISDSNYAFYPNLIQNLKNIYLLFLVKN
jgi:ubiquitin C-terminal hydrolase